MEDTPWIENRRYRPDCNDEMVVRDRDHRFAVARYEPTERFWVTPNFEVLDVTHWMEIPEVED